MHLNEIILFDIRCIEKLPWRIGIGKVFKNAGFCDISGMQMRLTSMSEPYRPMNCLISDNLEIAASFWASQTYWHIVDSTWFWGILQDVPLFAHANSPIAHFHSKLGTFKMRSLYFVAYVSEYCTFFSEAIKSGLEKKEIALLLLLLVFFYTALLSLSKHTLKALWFFISMLLLFTLQKAFMAEFPIVFWL